ncbi:MAG TPA: polysaccharide deacetylase family protein [Blastococcus sp.]|jgi:peptidoglycan/xylan/chitin deacetylase (PgdA/CDA1 family)|nr:polysaccharide deacetylase family protein [Blastococcus sp.]
MVATSGGTGVRVGTFVPVLLYHAVTTTPGSHIAGFTVTPDEFARQLDAVLEAGRTPVTFGELLDAEGRGGAPERPVVITFDDGYGDFAVSALPALRARSLPSTLFLTTGWLDGGKARAPGPTDPMLAWSQLPELLDAGVELGAHSHSHPQLDTLTAAALREELAPPRQQLEDALGRPVDLLAYPHGYNGPRVRRAARSAGYRAAAAVRNALHRPGEDPFAVARLMVTRTTTARDVAAWLDGRGAPLAAPGEALATRGWRAYRRGRAILRGTPGSDYT